MWYSFIAYCKYILKRKKYAHSTFVYNFVMNVLQNKNKKTSWQDIETQRKKLLHDKRELCVLDLGAKGQKNKRISVKKVSYIAKNSPKSKKIGQILSKIVQYYQVKNIVEFGTSFGISTAYLANGNENCHVFTVEGCPEISKIATENFEKLKLKNIEQLNVDFDYALQNYANRFHNIDLFFVDGNHDFEPTIRYFETMKQYAKENTIFIFDDIYWSKNMTKAWQQIKNDSQVSITIDLFHIGIVFFRKGIVKQNFILKT